MDREFKLFFAVWLFYILVLLAIAGVVGYVALHFIMKWW